jgi:ribosomal-protein-alanine N-acetyltransferase
MVQRDLPEVMRIEEESFDMAWDEEDFLDIIRRRDVFAIAALDGKQIVGWCIYEYVGKHIIIHSIVVDLTSRRLGFGCELMDHVKQSLGKGRDKIIAHVGCHMGNSCRFFENRGFVYSAEEVGHYDEANELPSYRMTFLVDWYPAHTFLKED